MILNHEKNLSLTAHMLLYISRFILVYFCKSMGPQRSTAVKSSSRDLEFPPLLDVIMLLDAFTNTLVKKCHGKEFIPRLYY